MQTFYEHLKEDNSSVDNLGHNMPMSPKRKKQLNADRGVFKNFPVQQWVEYYPYKNSSVATKQELKILQSYEVYRNDAREFMDLVDQKLMKPFKNYYKEHDLPMKDLEDVIKLKDQLAPIVLQLKIHYNRPRPQKLSKVLTFFRQANFNVYPLKTAETPAYPSGHATEGRFVSLYLADRVPFEHKGNIKRIGDDIGNSRQIAGVHYPSDTEFGHQLAGAFYSHYKEKSGIKETKLHFEGISDLNEASVMQGKYKTGFQFLYNGKWGKLNSLGYKSGDVFEVEDDKDLPVDIGTGDARKQLKAPDGKSITLAGTSSSYGSYFTRLPDGNPTPAGEDWEALIAVAVNDKQEGAEWDRAEKFWANYGEDAVKIGKAFKKKLGITELEQFGSSTAKLNPKWKGKNKTPKTDLLGNKRKRKISLKKAGGSQLMSGKKEETISTFESAMSMMGENSPRQVKSVIDSLEKKMGEMNEKGTIGALEKLRDSGKPLTPAQKKSIEQMENLQFTAKELTAEMDSLFESLDFKQFFCYEAATGIGKFAEPLAVANELVEFNADNGTITKHLPMNKPSDAKVLAQTNKFYVSFKTGGGGSKPYLSMRSGKVNFKQIVKEELQKERMGMQLLHEGAVEQLDEFQMFSRLVQKVKDVGSMIKNQAKKILNAIMKRVKAVFKKIKNLGKGMFNALLNFFGLQVQTVKITSSAKSFPLV